MLDLDNNKKYLLACSFGPDSMALFHMLIKEKMNFIVAHVNYHLREESNDEERKLREVCLNNNVDIYVKNVDEKINKNIEEKAREIRYNFFADIYKKNNCDGLLVAHNLDDHLETYILQKNRKNIVKYFGIARISTLFNMNVIRPLLNYEKHELLNYCIENNVDFAIDKTNLIDTFERNKIRHHFIEKLSKEEKEILSKEIKDKNEKLFELLSIVNDFDSHYVNDLLSLSDTELAIYLVERVRKYIPSFEISIKTIKEIRKKLLSKKPNLKIILATNVFLIKNYDEFKISCEINKIFNFIYKIESPIELDTPYFYLDFRKDSSNRNVSKESYPIFVRPLKPNDIVQIKDYKCTGRRLMIDWKMPTELRQRWPIILNKNNEIIYVPRYQNKFLIKDGLNFYVK